MNGAGRALLSLVVGQVFLHSAMAGLRLAVPLLVLRLGGSEWQAGLLLAVFAAAPAVLAMPAGRWVDRHGYHRPMRLAVMLVTLGGVGGVAGALLAGAWQLTPPQGGPGLAATLALVACALGAGAGCNLGLIAIQRTAGRLAAHDTREGETGAALRRTFAWLGLAPSVSNVFGPVLTGILIDLTGFGTAMAVMAVFPLAALATMRRVPPEPPPPEQARPPLWRSLQDLLADPRIRRLLAMNWFFSAAWDLHTFLVPLLGHERCLSASAIGMVLGTFAASVSGVRVLIPLLAERLKEHQVLSGALLLAGLCCLGYGWAGSTAAMLACAVPLGMALGSAQPMIMTLLHQVSPPGREGEAIALRSMLLNLSSALTPLGLGAAGGWLGAAGMFRLAGAVLTAAAWLPRRWRTDPPPP
jgi:MFS family permease